MVQGAHRKNRQCGQKDLNLLGHANREMAGKGALCDTPVTLTL
jgi:hypothetical protein